MSAQPFSYAQAARGRPAAQTNQQQEASSAPPSTAGSQVKDDASTGATSVTAPSVASTNTDPRDTEQPSLPQAEDRQSKPHSKAPSVADSASSEASVSEASKKPSGPSGAKHHEHRSQTRSYSDDKTSRSTSRTSRANDSVDGKKAKKGKRGRASDKDTRGAQSAQSAQSAEEDAEKEKEPPKPVVLTEAPLPAVNPWAQRMEARKAAAVQAKVTPEDSAPAEPKQDAAPADAASRSTATNGETKWAQKKPEGSRQADQAPRRSGPRGSRAGDKDDKAPVALHPVADPASWPDPKAAAEQEAKKTQTKAEKPEKADKADKADTAEKEAPEEAGPARKKTWEKLDIVPSVVFETQLPQIRGSKPRSSAPRGSRGDSTSAKANNLGAAAGPQTPATSASDKTPSNAGTSGPKTGTNTRPRDGSIVSRAAAQPQQPHASKRSPADAAARDQRKPSAPANATEPARDANAVTPSTSKRASATRDIRLDTGFPNSENGQGSATRGPQQDRNGFPARGEFAKDGAHGQQFPARDGRPERGRGSFRGRGGHGNSAGHHPSPSYSANGHFPATNGFQSRQSPTSQGTAPFANQFPSSFGHPQRGRGNKWAGQSAARNGHAPAGFPPKAAAQVNDFAVGQYQPYMYPPVLDVSIPVLKAQIEYYFSVENLCKDYYLRKHMDGQGFVHLSTIANFKRVKMVTEDLELVRFVCSLSDKIEFGVGEDGIERLRAREKWQPFVLPPSEREEAFRNDGPQTWTPYVRPDAHMAGPFPNPMVPQPYPPVVAGGFPAYADGQIFSPTFPNGAPYDAAAVNGAAVNGHHAPETRLTAGVPEYAPPQSPVTLESMTNFPDSQVEKLMVVLSYDGEKGEAGASSEAGVAGYVSDAPHSLQNGVPAPAADASSATESTTAEPAAGSDIVWVDGQAPASAAGQTDRKPYTEIRNAALEQRRNAKDGETPKEMQKLYKFWSHLLLNDFNAKVYQEFRSLALEDASRETPSTCGLKNLLDFYNKLLLSSNARKPWPQDRAVPEIFTAHMNEAVELNRRLGGNGAAAI
ncbi:hypothetical protein VTJ83DRAFT_2038 [Remersonia thermophila]|uniref:HTH La-type RNA-binding domain-containing protein n=1 Tax=Remersonia thermophila TaxID=72144 RepID=A0ABR4DIJ9_9PEZI